uniref:Uncharacterized protein n=1 Tax=Knipowitschia caucasica TaxID=637954 RepID=A0AAV2K6E8_KNICA
MLSWCPGTYTRSKRARDRALSLQWDHVYSRTPGCKVLHTSSRLWTSNSRLSLREEAGWGSGWFLSCCGSTVQFQSPATNRTSPESVQSLMHSHRVSIIRTLCAPVHGRYTHKCYCSGLQLCTYQEQAARYHLLSLYTHWKTPPGEQHCYSCTGGGAMAEDQLAPPLPPPV